MSTTETSMRDDLEAAISASEETEVESTEAVVEETTDDTITAADFEQEEESGDEESETAEAQAASETPEGEVSGEIESAEAAEPDAAVESADGDQPDIEKAPTSWPPAAREGWKELPEPVRAQVAKREREIALALEDGKINRKTGENFKSVVDKYAQVMAAEDVQDPIQGVEKLMQSVSVLRMGTPEQKAMKIAHFIKGYGVPIEVLDGILAGDGAAAPIAGQVADPTTQLIDQRLAPVNELLSKIENAEKQRNFENNQKMIDEVKQFSAANEFYEDVKKDMADLVDIAANRGDTMSLEDAYNKACAMHPEVSKVLEQRRQNEALIGQQETVNAKREAASSITGDQGGTPQRNGSLSLRDQIEEAFNQQVG